MFTFPLKNDPIPEGFQIRTDGVRLSRVYKTEDEAYTAAEAKGLVDFEVVPVE